MGQAEMGQAEMADTRSNIDTRARDLPPSAAAAAAAAAAML